VRSRACSSCTGISSSSIIGAKLAARIRRPSVPKWSSAASEPVRRVRLELSGSWKAIGKLRAGAGWPLGRGSKAAAMRRERMARLRFRRGRIPNCSIMTAR
jgi:hypothetical protein